MLGDAAHRPDADACSPSATAPGWTWWTTCAGSTAGSASPGSASGTAGGTSTSCRATAKRSGWSPPGAFDLHNPGSAFGEPYVVRGGFGGGVDLLHGVARQRDPALPLPLAGSTARASRSGSRRATSPGYHTYKISPDGRWAFHTLLVVRHAARGRPRPPARSTRSVRTLVENRRLSATRWRGSRRGPAEFVKVDAGGGLELDGWIMKPPGFDSTKRYPVLFHVYGEPAGQTVLDQWDGGNYLWHLMLTQQGYVVASVDNRGTPVAARARLAEGDLPEDRHGQLGRSGGRRADHAAMERGWTRPGSASGAGAAAARRRST